jgi:DNA-binding XRE family transcriptional regulator
MDCASLRHGPHITRFRVELQGKNYSLRRTNAEQPCSMGQKFNPLPEFEIEICRRFKFAREDAGVTQERIGLHVGLSRDQVASIEAGRVALRFWHGWKFCTELDINAEWMALGLEPYRPWLDYFKVWAVPPEIRDEPDILFSRGFNVIEDRYRKIVEEERPFKRPGGSLRKELGRPVHKSGEHKAAMSLLINGWLADIKPESRDAFVAHLCKAAEAFKIRLRRPKA